MRICVGETKLKTGKMKKVFVSLDDLYRHFYCLGSTGTGKSTLIKNVILGAFGQGVCTWVIDPHGDLAYDIVESVYAEDLRKVLLFDPIEVGFSLNPFELPKYEESDQREIMVERLIGEIVSFMKKLYGERYWGPSLNRIFQNALRRLYMNDDSPTFKELLALVKEEMDKDEYKDFYDDLGHLPKGRTDSVINKLEPFVKNDLLRKLFCQKISTVDVEKLLEPGRLVVWRLSKGELSEMNAGLIGSALITKLWLAILSRKSEKRFPLFLAIDEFQNFSHLQTLGNMVTEGRKYKVALLLAHQHTKQVPEKLLGDVLGNTATKMVFRVSEKDGRVVANSFDYPDKNRMLEVLTSLPDGRAIVKLRSSFGEDPIPPFEISTLKPPMKMHSFTGKLLERMRLLYSAPKLPEKPSINSDKHSEIIQLLKAVNSLENKGEELTAGNLLRNVNMTGSRMSELLDIAQSDGLVKRIVKKNGVGRPKVLTELTEKGKKNIGIGVSTGSGAKAGGELHRALLFKAKEWLEEQGYRIKIPAQGGPGEQPDLLVKPKESDREIAVEIETSANHPGQVVRNYEKNANLKRLVIFVVPNKEVENKVRACLGKFGKKKFYIYVLENNNS
jgi:DNA helicase HerA-like ATPase